MYKLEGEMRFVKVLVFSAVICFLTALNLFAAEALPDANEVDYQNALSLVREGKYDEAISILSGLTSKYTDVKYKFSHIDAMLEKGKVMKEANDPNWKKPAKEVQTHIKNLYLSNYTNADYWVLYVKFGALIDKEGEVSGGFKKLLYYKPGNTEALLLQGDIYSRLAQSAKEQISSNDNSLLNTGRDEKKYRWTVARNAYKSAVASTSLSDEKKSEIYCKLGDIEMQGLNNKEDAVNYWNQSVSAQPNGKWAAMAQERLNKYK
jgi:tetratricopeptide (TPR) repeat protein